TVLPARPRPPHLHVDEPVGRIVLPHVGAPAQRQAEPAHAEVEHGAGGQRRGRREQSQADAGGRDAQEVRGIGEEREHLGALARSGAESVRGLGPGSIRAFVTLGVLGLTLSTQLAYIGYAYTTAANAAILQAATPVLVALGARAYLGERLRRRQQLGVAISTLGVLVVVPDGRLWRLRPEDLRAGD